MGITCKVCKKPNPEYLFHCAEHYKCEGCGTTEGLCTHVDRLTCAPCDEALMAKRVAAFEGDTDYTSEVVCPHCGHESRDSWDISEGVTECGDCGHEFELTRNVSVTYTTRKAA